jgi:ABC-2 type transport system ATP-binding protein
MVSSGIIEWTDQNNTGRIRVKQTAIIEIKQLTKQYGTFKALDNLRLRVASGEIYGFLGPNGAGKTTTIKILLDIIKPTTGKVSLFGQELNRTALDIKRKIGVVSEKQYIYKEMTAGEYLDFFGELYRVPHKAKRIDALLEQLDLSEVKHKRLALFSHGMQQKVGFARAFLHDPDLFILDEPILGLDPKGVKQIRDLICAASQRGKTVFISSHLLSEVEKLCHKVGIINQGTLLAEATMEELKKRLVDVTEVVVELLEIKPGIVESLAGLDFVRKVRQDGNVLGIQVMSDRDHRAEISRMLTEKGGVVLGINAKEMSLEEAFMKITSQNISLLADTTK